MKKLVMGICLFFIVASSYAQIWSLTASEYASRTLSYNEWTEWDEWTECNVNIKMSPQLIVINSNVPQMYYVQGLLSSTSTTYKWSCRDWRGWNCVIRFVIKSSGTQIYIQYPAIQWVYNVTVD